MDIKLNGHVAISVAESSDMEMLGMTSKDLHVFILELSRKIIDAGGKLVYGGKLEKGGFTEGFVNFTNFTNYLAWPYYNMMTEDEINRYQTSPINLVKAKPSEYVIEDMVDKYLEPSDDETRFLFATSMTSMRLQVEQNAEARILVGGKTTGFSGCMPGTLEEFIIAMRSKHPVYLIGGFGGATKIITEIIERKGNISSKTLLDVALLDTHYKSLYDLYAKKNQHIDVSLLDEIKIENLDNGLTEKQNLQLFHTTNTDEIIKLVLTGLNTKLS